MIVLFKQHDPYKFFLQLKNPVYILVNYPKPHSHRIDIGISKHSKLIWEK